MVSKGLQHSVSPAFLGLKKSADFRGEITLKLGESIIHEEEATLRYEDHNLQQLETLNLAQVLFVECVHSTLTQKKIFSID